MLQLYLKLALNDWIVRNYIFLHQNVLTSNLNRHVHGTKPTVIEHKIYNLIGVIHRLNEQSEHEPDCDVLCDRKRRHATATRRQHKTLATAAATAAPPG